MSDPESPDDDLDDDDLYDYGPLRLERRALAWSSYTCDGRVVQIGFPHTGDHKALSEVVLSDDREVVSITLFHRVLMGTWPGGTTNAEVLDLRYSWVGISLREPLGARALIDGSTGEPARHFDAAAEPSWKQLFETDGCPLWVP